jgi:hypothetical protein
VRQLLPAKGGHGITGELALAFAIRVAMSPRMHCHETKRRPRRGRALACAQRHARTGSRPHACSFIEAAAGSAHTPSAKATAPGKKQPRVCHRWRR